MQYHMDPYSLFFIEFVFILSLNVLKFYIVGSI